MAIGVKWKHSFLPDQVHCLFCIREGILYAEVVSFLHLVKELVSLGIQSSCIQTSPKKSLSQLHVLGFGIQSSLIQAWQADLWAELAMALGYH